MWRKQIIPSNSRVFCALDIARSLTKSSFVLRSPAYLPKNSRRWASISEQYSIRRWISTSSQPRDKNGTPFGNIYWPSTHTIENEAVTKSIRCCLTGYNQEDHNHYTRDTGMSLMFLGTSAGIPSRSRSTTSTLLRMGGQGFLFDAGEGVQRQMAFTRAKPSHINHIFITHMHGDHIFGLPGFLLGLQHSIKAMQTDKKRLKNRKSRKNTTGQHTVRIYGPPGLYNYIAANIVLSCTVFHSIHIEVHELVGGRVRRSHGYRNVRNPFEANYPEFNYGFLSRKFIPCENGVWNIQKPAGPLTRNEVMASGGNMQNNSVSIQAAEVDHLSGIPTFGYVVQEGEPPGNIDAAKARELGVSPMGKKFELLKFGFSVHTDDGNSEVKPEQVLKPRTKKARKVAIIGDNRNWTNELRDIAENADVLVHEATLAEEDWNRGHSTAGMAGQVSGEINAKLLILNHISSKFDHFSQDGISWHEKLTRDARDASRGISDVLLSYDFMEILPPWLGFAPEEASAHDSNEGSLKERSSEESHVDVDKVVKKWFSTAEVSGSKKTQ